MTFTSLLVAAGGIWLITKLASGKTPSSAPGSAAPGGDSSGWGHQQTASGIYVGMHLTGNRDGNDYTVVGLSNDPGRPGKKLVELEWVIQGNGVPSRIKLSETSHALSQAHNLVLMQSS